MLPVLSCGSTLLRPYAQEDIPSLIRHISNPRIAANTLQIPYPYTLKDAQGWLNALAAPVERSRMYCFAIDNGAGEVIGGIGHIEIVSGHKAEIGYWLSEDYWGRGIMTEAVSIATRFARERFGVWRNYAYVYTYNTASVRVLEHAGYVREGTLRGDICKNGGYVDTHLYAHFMP